MNSTPSDISDLVKARQGLLAGVYQEAGKVLVGQRSLLDRLLIGLLTGGHVLLEGLPGLAKTLTVRTLAQTLQLGFRRIQFTPDLLPADVVGTQIYNPRSGEFTVKKGPIFSNLVLADEINRAPAKVQSALLEAMEEKQVTLGEHTYPLDEPFLVLATQNPVEQEGTYPLPEAQLDRFMLKVVVGYPTKDEERLILKRRSAVNQDVSVLPVLTPSDLVQLRHLIDQIYLDESVEHYIVDLVQATRLPADYGLDIGPYLQFGASPRGTIFLTRAARAHALLDGRGYVTPHDVKTIAPDVLRHRLLLTYEAEADEVTTSQLLQRVLDTVPVP